MTTMELLGALDSGTRDWDAADTSHKLPSPHHSPTHSLIKYFSPPSSYREVLIQTVDLNIRRKEIGPNLRPGP